MPSPCALCRNFLRQQTKHTKSRSHIVSSLIAATELLADQQDPADIRSLFSSQIRRDLWDEYISRLDTRSCRAHFFRKRHVRLEWVWSFDEEDWVLRLLNLVSGISQKASNYVFGLRHQQNKHLQEWSNRRFDIWPEQQSNGQWRVRELPTERAGSGGYA